MKPGQPDTAERVVDLAMAEPYERALLTLRGYAAALLDPGYPTNGLYEELVRARDELERREAPEGAEDVVLDVSDFLVGYCAPHMKL
ncbi:hypothetical protein BH23ACT11_BH23ACT11_01400 [soil metagenome]